MQKHAKKNQKNASVVKNALSRRSQKKQFLEPFLVTKLAHFQIVLTQFESCFFKKHTETHIEAHFEIRAAKGGRDKPKTKHQELQRTKNLHIQKP